jgi:Flp pilus assembly protein TadD
LATLACSTAQRNEVYATEVSFWQAAVTQSPDNARAANNLGMAYAMNCQRRQALHEFTRAAVLDPQDFHARINLMLLQKNSLPGLAEHHCNQ